jgi:hypothetical protein
MKDAQTILRHTHIKTTAAVYMDHIPDSISRAIEARTAASCNLRDMGTHLCALPTGEHCPKGLICLGCAHAQPKKSAVPIFRRMLT